MWPGIGKKRKKIYIDVSYIDTCILHSLKNEHYSLERVKNNIRFLSFFDSVIHVSHFKVYTL